MKNLKQLSNRLIIPANEMNEDERIMYKRFNDATIVELKENHNFKLFYKKLDEYFLGHNMMNLKLEKVEGYNCLFTENEKTICKKPESIIKIFDKNICNVTILPKKEGIELYRLEVYNTGRGIGTILMNAFNTISEETGIKIYLMLGEPGFNEEGNRTKRRNFYHKHGFKRCIDSKYWVNN